MKKIAIVLAGAALAACSSSSEIDNYSKLSAAVRKDFPDICVEENSASPAKSKFMNCTPDRNSIPANFFVSSGSDAAAGDLVTNAVRFSATLPNSEFQKYGDFYRKTVGRLPFGNSTLADKFNNLDTLVAACFAARPNDFRCELDNESVSYPGGIFVQKGARQTTSITINYKRAEAPAPKLNDEIVQPSDCDKAILSSFTGDLLVTGTLSIGKLNTDRISKGSLRINGKDYLDEFQRICNRK